jgi:aminoglycoside phosphotransferase (APT) family kinase protein
MLLSDPSRLVAWFDAHIAPPSGVLRITKIRGGSSNSLFRIERNGIVYALRRPPVTANHPTSHDLSREILLLTALGRTSIPHSRLIAATTDTSWIGSPFMLLTWVTGFTPRDPMPAPFDHDLEARRMLGESVIDSLADIGQIDWRRIDLARFGKPEGFLGRQVDRWRSQYETYATREVAGLDDLSIWLRKNVPARFEPALMHGDYSFANIIIAPHTPARVAAVLDWELATIGDPLLDLGHVLSSWGGHGDGTTWADYVDWDRGFAARREMADRYALRSGRDIGKLPFYMALALFRLAVLLEGSYARWLKGRSTNPRHAVFETRVPAIILQGVRTIEHY